MEYLSVKQVSELWGISKRRIQTLCMEDRIPGAMRIGTYWAIPADAEKPNDQRIKSGKYIKSFDDNTVDWPFDIEEGYGRKKRHSYRDK